ncbi:MAG: NADH-quinone oxidoreductase subunit M [bacterium]
MNPLLITLLIPIFGAVLLQLLPNDKPKLINKVAFIFSIAAFLSSLALLIGFNTTTEHYQFYAYYPWISDLNAGFRVGIDGLSLMLVLLTTFIIPLAIWISSDSIKVNMRQYYSLILLLEFAIIGVFISLDLLVFYIFWELILIPMYFIIGIWGGKNKIYATVKFFIYTMVGSLVMIIGIIWLGHYIGTFVIHNSVGFTTSLPEIQKYASQLPIKLQNILFWMFAISFLIKVPIFPLHTWLPDAHTEAPTAGSVILAGVLLKMGAYGLIRFNIGIFPAASLTFAPLLVTLGVVGIIYGGLLAWMQKDMKRLVAYSSVAHMGFIIIGIFSFTVIGMQGAIIQMVNHGLTTGMLFIAVGFLYDQRHTRLTEDYGGIARIVPKFTVFFGLAVFASIGLPGLNGFVGEFMSLYGTFSSTVLNNHTYAIVASSGVIIAAVYLLIMYKKAFFGKIEKPENNILKDINLKYGIIFIVITFFMFWIGIFPTHFLKFSEATANKYINHIELIIDK